MRVRAWDAAGNIGNDNSNAVFSIIPAVDTVAPTVHVAVPNGGESWNVNTYHNITWTASDNVGVTQYKLDYSIDAGANWTIIQDWTSGNPGTFPWLVPISSSTQVRVRVSCRDAAGNVGNDNSDNNFTILDPLPVVTVSSPNGGEIWDCGSAHNITWIDGDNLGILAYKLEHSTDAGTNWSLIQDWTAGDPRTYSWVIPNTPSILNRIRISCRDTSGGIGTDVSNTNFTIRDNIPPSVALTYPNGGESFDSGANADITWNASDNIGVTAYKIDYSTDSGTNWISVQDWQSGNPSSFIWTIPDTPSALCRTRVSCRDSANTVGFDISDSDFSIRDNIPPIVNISSPNGGEIWGINQIHAITWTASDNAGVAAFKLDYSINGGATWLAVTEWVTGNPGTYSWNVPNAPSTACRVRLFCRDASFNVTADTSDANFAIADFPPTVTVISPNGGEAWGFGETHNIAWNASDDIGITRYKIEYSLNRRRYLDSASNSRLDRGKSRRLFLACASNSVGRVQGESILPGYLRKYQLRYFG